MANSYHLEIVTPERLLLSEEVIETNAPGVEGYLGVLAGHMALLTALAPGEVRARFADSRPQGRFVVSGGFLQISPTKTTILADSAERVEEIDLAQAETDVAERRRKVADVELGSPDYKRALLALAHAEARVRAARA